MGVDKYKGLTRRSGSRTVWKGAVREDHGSLELPVRWKKPKKVFVNSMSDLLHPGASSEFIQDVWSVIERTPCHSNRILTKCPDRMADMSASRLPALPNVWLGTSVEGGRGTHLIDELRAAAVRFISFEPLIGSIGRDNLSEAHWATVGGENGPGAWPVQESQVDEMPAIVVM